MKILQVINSLGTGGAEKLLLETIPLYREAGIEMDILLLWDDQHPFTQQLKQLNICRVFVLNESSRVRDVYNPLNIFKMRRIMKDYPLIHVHLFPAQYFAVIANTFNFNKASLIFTEHNTSNNRINNKIFKPVEKLIYSAYKKVVCISEEIKVIYQNYLKNYQNKLLVINNGVDLNNIKSAIPLKRSELGFQNNDKVIIQVSAFRPQKDQDTLIRAMCLLPDNYKLLLVGDGERKTLLQNLVENLQLEKKIFFLGNRMDVPRLLKTADVIVLSSHYEGLSLSSVEALASGKPFIASDVPGLRDVVNNAGVLFDNGDEKMLADIIQNIIENPLIANSIVEKSIIKSKNYSIDKMVQQHINLYKSII